MRELDPSSTAVVVAVQRVEGPDAVAAFIERALELSLRPHRR